MSTFFAYASMPDRAPRARCVRRPPPFRPDRVGLTQPTTTPNHARLDFDDHQVDKVSVFGTRFICQFLNLLGALPFAVSIRTYAHISPAVSVTRRVHREPATRTENRLNRREMNYPPSW